jgi:hypothetical protein
MEAHGARQPSLEPEPTTWQPRVLWASGRLLAGAITFFFISFLFAYFYLRSLDLNRNWRIGPHVHPSIGLGVGIIVSLLASAALLRLAARRPLAEMAARPASMLLAAGSLAFALLAIALQCISYTVQKFGPASGGYASVYVGWTVFYAVFALGCVYWITTQVTTLWRRRREGAAWAAEERVVYAGELELMGAGLESCSFFWSYYVFIGFVTFVILYLV